MELQGKKRTAWKVIKQVRFFWIIHSTTLLFLLLLLFLFVGAVSVGACGQDCSLVSKEKAEREVALLGEKAVNEGKF